MVGTVTFSAKKSYPCSGVCSRYAVGTQYTVGMQYAVDVGAKRSTHTVHVAKMDGGDCYL